MDNSDSESHTEEIEVPARGRPVGKADSTKRYRRTAAEISADKIHIAQMKLDALKANEEQKLAVKAAARKRRPAAIEEKPVPPARKERPAKIETTKKVSIREDTDSEESPQRPRKSGREALYDSWFPSSPRTNHSVRRFPF